MAGISAGTVLTPEPDKLDRILEAIDFTRNRLETKIGEVAEGLNLLRADHSKLKDRVSSDRRASCRERV